MTLSAAAQVPRLPKYDLVEEIGHGGMATVYRALDRRLGREVALKVIHRHLRENAEVARRFTAEARAVAKLRHPNIVEIYDVSDDDAPERYITAELVRGKSMRKLLLTYGALPIEVVACLGIELCGALCHAHERGVVHRDVKPENVLVAVPEAGPDETDERPVVQVKLTDFGIAKLLDQQGVTATGQVLGSAAYMPPEQIECGDVDGRSDVFALGVTLYEAAVGHLPFDGKNPAQVIRRVLDGRYAAAEREVSTIGARFSRILDRCLAPQQADRFPTASALRADLEAELSALGIDDVPRELVSFFGDPDGYRERLPPRVVPRLLARGQSALRRGDVVEAAAHLNRAVAFSPTDPTVLAAMKALTRSRSLDLLRERARLAAAFAGVLVGAAAIAFFLRSRIEHVPRAQSWPELSARPVEIGPEPPLPPSSATAAQSAPPPPLAPSSHRPAIPSVGQPAPSARHAGERRSVRFNVFPLSAVVLVNGEELPPGQRSLDLATGSRASWRALLPSASLSCCDEPEKRGVVEVEAGNGDEQIVWIRFKPKPATLVSQGPVGLQIRCPKLQITGNVNGSYTIPMGNNISLRDTCYLLDGTRPMGDRDVAVEAGQRASLSW